MESNWTQRLLSSFGKKKSIGLLNQKKGEILVTFYSDFSSTRWTKHVLRSRAVLPMPRNNFYSRPFFSQVPETCFNTVSTQFPPTLLPFMIPQEKDRFLFRIVTDKANPQFCLSTNGKAGRPVCARLASGQCGPTHHVVCLRLCQQSMLRK